MKSRLSNALLALLLSSVVAACGGGGGGSRTSGPPAPPPPPPPGGAGGTLPISPDSNAEAVALGVATAEAALQIGQLAANAVIEYASPAFAVAGSCLTTGTKTGSLVDNDNDFGVSGGDTLTIEYFDCFETSIDDLASGTLTIALDAFSISDTAVTVSGSLVTGPGFTISDRIDPNQVVTVDAAYRFSFSLDAVDENLDVAAAGTESLALTALGVTETINSFTVSKTAHPPIEAGGRWTTELDVALAYNSALLGGSFTCESTEFRYGTGSRLQPLDVNFTCRGQRNSAVRVIGAATVQVDGNGNGNFTDVGLLDWGAVVEGFLGTNSDTRLADILGELPVGTIQLSTSDIDFDEAGNRALVVTTDADGRFPSALVEIDAASGAVSRLVSFAEEPKIVRVADDGSTIYVAFVNSGTLQRYDGATAQLIDTVDIDYSLAGSDPEVIEGIAVSPTDPAVVAVIVRESSFINNDVFIVNDMQQTIISYRDIETETEQSFENVDFNSTGTKVIAPGGVLMSFDNTGFVQIERARTFAGSTSVGQRILGGTIATDETTLVRLGTYPASAQFAAHDEATDLSLALSSGTLQVLSFDRYNWVGEYDLNIDLQGQDQLETEIVIGGGLVFIRRSEVINVLQVSDLAPNRDDECTVETAQTAGGEDYVNYRCTMTTAVYDDVRDRIYGAIPGHYGVNGNSIVVIDNATDSVLQYVPVGSEPARLAISADASTLFIGHNGADIVTEVGLDTLATNRVTQIPLSEPLSPTGNAQQRQSIELQASPVDAALVVLELHEGLSAQSLDEYVALRDGVWLADSLVRNNRAAVQAQTALFDSLGALYSIGYRSPMSYEVEEIIAGQNGLTAGPLTSVADASPFFSDFILSQGQAIFDTGDTIDLTQFTATASFDLFAPPGADGGATGIVDDPSNGKIYFLHRSDAADVERNFAVSRFDAATGDFEATENLFGGAGMFAIGDNRLGWAGIFGLVVVDKSAID